MTSTKNRGPMHLRHERLRRMDCQPFPHPCERRTLPAHLDCLARASPPPGRQQRAADGPGPAEPHDSPAPQGRSGADSRTARRPRRHPHPVSQGARRAAGSPAQHVTGRAARHRPVRCRPQGGKGPRPAGGGGLGRGRAPTGGGCRAERSRGGAGKGGRLTAEGSAGLQPNDLPHRHRSGPGTQSLPAPHTWMNGQPNRNVPTYKRYTAAPVRRRREHADRQRPPRADTPRGRQQARPAHPPPAALRRPQGPWRPPCTTRPAQSDRRREAP